MDNTHPRPPRNSDYPDHTGHAGTPVTQGHRVAFPTRSETDTEDLDHNLIRHTEQRLDGAVRMENDVEDAERLPAGCHAGDRNARIAAE